jgi:ubiquinone/menaquinone biosynthesis C-methylase UbiE
MPTPTIDDAAADSRLLDVRHFESELTALVRRIPPGVDPVLDDLREDKTGDNNYSTSLNRQVRAFLLYRTYAETGIRFLDWGCRHAWDSCMIRMVNPDASIEGCDITEEMVEENRSFARMRYTQLTHSWNLPYEDSVFDRIICSGVLEHVPILGASLTEINRVMAPGGYLIITFLPNQLSYTEFASRNIFKRGYHRRLYSRSRLKKLLLEHGFEPIEVGFHQVLPSLTMGHASIRWQWMGRAIRAMFKLDPIVERIWPLRLFGANLYAIACKREYI